MAKTLGRPRKILDERKITELIGKGFTVEFVADFCGVHVDTLYVNYSEALRKGRVFRDGCLQAKQLKEAMKGNVTLLVWLGKQWLAQRDKLDVVSEEKGKLGFGDLPIPASTNAGSTHRPN